MGLTYGTVFTGVEGFGEAFKRLGWRCLWQIEKDEKCRQVLDYRWPDVARYGDVSHVKFDKLQRVELVAGGFPCQDVSVAGRRAGLAGARSGLFFRFLDLIDAVKPTWVLLENVPGLLSSNDGRDMGAILWSLGERGFRVSYRVLDAQFFGVAQRRRRVWIVGYSGNLGGLAKAPPAAFLRRLPGIPVEVLFEQESCTGDIGASRSKRAEITKALAQGSVSSGYRHDASVEDFIIEGPSPPLRTNREQPLAPERQAYQCQGSNVGPAGTLRTGRGKDAVPFLEEAITQPLTTKWNAGSDGGSRGFPIVPDAQVVPITERGRPGGRNLEIGEEGVMPALTNPGDGGRTNSRLIAILHGQGDTRVNEGELAYGLDTKSITSVVTTEDDITHALTTEYDASEDGNGRGTPLITCFTQNSRSEVRMVAEAGEITGALAAQPGAQQQNYLMISDDDRKVMAFSFQQGDDSGSEPDGRGRSQLHRAGPYAGTLQGSRYDAICEYRDAGSIYEQETKTITGEVLLGLRKAVGEKAFEEWANGILVPFQAKEVLRSAMHGKEFRFTTNQRKCELEYSPLPRQEDLPVWALFKVWEEERQRCSPQRWELEKQSARKFRTHLSKLSQQGTQIKDILQGLWESSEGIGLLRKALSEIQEIWQSVVDENQSTHSNDPGTRLMNFGVRRLTPLETERLQSFPDEATRWGWKTKRNSPAVKVEIKDSVRYKMMGNAVCINNVYWIACRIDHVHKEIQKLLERKANGKNNHLSRRRKGRA